MMRDAEKRSHFIVRHDSSWLIVVQPVHRGLDRYSPFDSVSGKQRTNGEADTRCRSRKKENRCRSFFHLFLDGKFYGKTVQQRALVY